MGIKFKELVRKEIDQFIYECNFTDDELMYFELKCKDKSNIQIADALGVSESKVSCLARQVKSKINKVI